MQSQPTTIQSQSVLDNESTMTQQQNIVTTEINNSNQVDNTSTSQSNGAINSEQTVMRENYFDDRKINTIDDGDAHHQQELSDVEEEPMNVDSMKNNDLQRHHLQPQFNDELTRVNQPQEFEQTRITSFQQHKNSRNQMRSQQSSLVNQDDDEDV